MDDIIATTKVLVQKQDAEPVEVTASIGRPRQIGDDPEEWACSVSLDPLYTRLHDAHGGCALQALCLGASLLLDLLHAVVEKGGTVALDDGTCFPFEAYSFGQSPKPGRPVAERRNESG